MGMRKNLKHWERQRLNECNIVAGIMAYNLLNIRRDHRWCFGEVYTVVQDPWNRMEIANIRTNYRHPAHSHPTDDYRNDPWF